MLPDPHWPWSHATRQNGYRHENRGYMWLEYGYDDRAARSFEKARREFNKADRYDRSLGVLPVVQNLINVLSGAVSRSIMTAGSSDQPGLLGITSK